MISNLLAPLSALLSVAIEILVGMYSTHKLYWLHVLPNKTIDLSRTRFRHLHGLHLTIRLFPLHSDLWFSSLTVPVTPILHKKSPSQIRKRFRNTTPSLTCSTCANPDQYEITIELHSTEKVI
jgi:hypothetical protein